MTDPTNALPLDERSRQALVAQGLDLAVLATGNDPGADTAQAVAAHERWLQAYHRGFHFDALSPEQLVEYRAALAAPRTVGVWDSTSAEAEHPIATVASWRSPLSVGQGRAVEGWAISLVSVATTHRRRGIANALLEGELRSAHAAGIPVAMLTVSEATIYGRWGFGPAACVADLRIDARALRVTAPLPDGRVHRVSVGSIRAVAPEVARRASEARAGEVPPLPHYWDRALALSSRTASRAASLRAARYDDVASRPQGFVLYSVAENPSDFADHTLTIEYLCAATDDALIALWHYVLDHDLVSTVVAPMRPVDDPLPWLVSNPRAVRTTARTDHLWLRVLDVSAALTARRYAAADEIVLRVTDPLGFAAGEWMLSTTADGAATVTAAPTPGSLSNAAVIDLGVAELGALMLGGASAEQLRVAARLTEAAPRSALRLDAVLRPERAPHLSHWF